MPRPVSLSRARSGLTAQGLTGKSPENSVRCSGPGRKAAGASSPVGEWGDDQPWGVAQVLVRVLDLGIADVGKAVLLLLIPAVPQLGLPGEGLGALHLREEQAGLPPGGP